jgi:GMP synthase (glutamine-hydrolysing)
MEHLKKIGIVDFGGQYAHLISSRVRRLGVYTEIISNNESIEKYMSYSGIILSGGPESVYEKNSPQINSKLLELGIPILGICYGHQLVMKLMSAEVKSSKTKEYGKASLVKKNESLLLNHFENEEQVWMSHGDEVTSLPNGFVAIGSTKDCNFAAVENREKKIFGIQFHPEVTHTLSGNLLLNNFIKICNAQNSWDIEGFLKEKIAEIKNQISEKKVFMLISGGVDSTVSYILLSRAIGKENLTGLLVDTGFMRKDEVDTLRIKLTKLGVDLKIEDSSNEFYSALKNKTEPEEKRKEIGELFLKIQKKVSERYNLNPDEWILGQGTIYPDTIESGGTKHSHKIKTHHNRVDGIMELIEQGKIIEPIKDLYKDEVRELGKLLGLDESIVDRHPFPGPGLAVRMIASHEYKDFTQREELNQISLNYDNLDLKILPIQSVGVQGDQRSYSACAVVNDSNKDWNVYEKISTDLTNSISQINRVVLLPFEEKLANTIFNYKKIHLDKFHSDLLREVDFIVNEEIFKFNLQKKIWQMPVVLLPIGKNGFSIVLRPVESEEAMTANFYKMDKKILKEVILKIKSIKEIEYVFYDITNKPPGTIEWE